MIWSGAQPTGRLATQPPVPVALQARELSQGPKSGDRIAPVRRRRIGRMVVRGASIAMFLLGVSAASAAAVWQYAAPRLDLKAPAPASRASAPAKMAVVDPREERVDEQARRRVHNSSIWSASAAVTGSARRGRKGVGVEAARTTEEPVAATGGRPNVAASYGWALAETLAGPARACAAGGDWVRRSPDGRTIYLCGGGRFRVQHDGRVLASCTAEGCDKTTLYHLVRGQ